MGIYDTGDASHLKLFEKVTTAPGAKTALLIPKCTASSSPSHPATARPWPRC
jgi:hypothetical protein